MADDDPSKTSTLVARWLPWQPDSMLTRKSILLSTALLTMLAGCDSTERTSWNSKSTLPSPYQASVYQTVVTGGIPAGQVTSYELRFERTDRPAAGSPCGTGWYVKFPLEGDDDSAPKPQLSWNSPDDLIVVVRTQMMDVRVVRRFQDVCGPDGSVTLIYKAST